ncbi:hypothetical protein [Shewanella sp. SR44-3]|uniref:hypothetical protein n=1 Tax=unclassified Shewanella TaxID=196818 RepID=UPI0015F9A609|nr:hypothetical protein [Shewanella sp. SR44-3]MBB1270303.1 hypothetical protein [Shewanella sp. SR44-3]
MAHLFIIAANLIWGGLPIFFFFFTDTSPLFMLTMQIVFTWLILHLVFNHTPSTDKGLKSWLKYIPSTCFIGANWGVYALTVQSGHALEASYAYLITPILFAIVDYLLPANRGNLTLLCLMLAALGLIAVDAMIEQVLPIAGIFIGACFTAYILWHRSQSLAPITALKRETSLLLPVAIVVLFTLLEPEQHWQALSHTQLWLLPLIGILTCLPLGLFILGSKKVSFSQISLYQFISPIAGTLVAVELFEENFSLSKMLIYAGLISILCLNLYLTRRQLVAKSELAQAVLDS